MSQPILNYQSLPVKLQQVLQKAELPIPLQVFCANLTRAIILSSFWVAFSCFLFIMALFFTVATWSCVSVDDGYGCNVATWSLHLWPDNALLDLLQIFWCMAFLLVLAFCLYHLIYHYRHRYLCVYPWGLFSTPNQSFPWERIKKVWRGWAGGNDSVQIDAIRLLRDDGKMFHFDKYHWNRKNAQERNALCDLIERELVRVHLPLLLEQLGRGERLSFGSLHVSSIGLANKKREISWEEVERFEVSETNVYIWKRGKASTWYYDYVFNMPNACLLREVAHLRLIRKG